MAGLTRAETTRLYLPSTKDEPEERRLWVDVRSRLYLSDKANVALEEDSGRKLVSAIASIIDSWNLTDEGGEPVSPTFDWVDAMDENDFLFLSEWANTNLAQEPEKLSDQENLTSSATSPVAETTVSPTIL